MADNLFKTPHLVEVKVVRRGTNGWADATITKIVQPSHDWKTPPNVGDSVAIPSKRSQKQKMKWGTSARLLCKVVPNQKRPLGSVWFATYCSELSDMNWESHQVGRDAIFLQIPSTKPGTSHDGLSFACWKCGQRLVESTMIHCIKASCVWTKTLLNPIQFAVDPLAKWNEYKQCNIQNVRCKSCDLIVGCYYPSRYEDADEEKPFPCFKLITAWERRKWHGDQPALAMVLLGTKADNEKSIVKLTVSDDWHVVKQYHIGGRLDKTTYTLIEKAKEAEERASLAEQRAKMVEEASKETEALLKRKELEAEELAKRAKELEDAKKVDANGKYASKEVVRWECLVDSKYVEYPPSVASILTQHHRLGEKAAFSLHGKQYEIDFAVSSQLESWEQVNVESGFRRKVRIKKVTSFQHLVPSWQCNVDGGWVEYPRIVSQILEAQYAEGGNVSFALNNTAYELDFAKMQQMNITSKFTRPVRRELRAIPCDLGTTDGIPSNWTFKTKSCDCELVSVPISSEEWKFVDEKLRGSISNAKLKEVQRVQNIPLWKYFEFQKERLAAKSGSGTANVQFVWHGTRTTHPSLICTDTHDGFMMQRSRQGSWGQGIYFAANASYSNSYAFTQKGLASNNKTLILVRLAVGEEVRLPSDSTLRHCPAKANGTGRYDTVTGDINGSTIFVVYENGRGYPEYLVTYTEK